MQFNKENKGQISESRIYRKAKLCITSRVHDFDFIYTKPFIKKRSS